MAQISLRDILIGPPLPTARMSHERLDNLRALAALSPDALAPIALPCVATIPYCQTITASRTSCYI